MSNALALAGAVLAIVSVVPYLIDIVKRRTKPNVVSWLTWTLLTGSATAATFAAGEPRTALLLLASTLACAMVLVLGSKYGIAKLSWFDVSCWVAVAIGLVLWFIFDSPTLTILVVVATDFIGALPTLRHSWLEPQEETWQTFVISSLAALLTVLSLSDYSIESLLYPAYLVVANGAIVAVVVVRRQQKGISLARHGVHETLHE